MKTLHDLERLHQKLMDNDDREHVDYSDLLVDEGCVEPMGTSSVWSWAVPLVEHGNRPRFLLIGDGAPESWEIVDVLVDPSGWPANLVIKQ